MSKKEVEITCSSKGLKEILVDGEELDCTAIKDKIIPAWFKPAQDRSGWRGLIPEIQHFLSDPLPELAFTFSGPTEHKRLFLKCLEDSGTDNVELSEEEKTETRIQSAKRAGGTGNQSAYLKNLLVAAQLGSAEAMRLVAECYRDGNGVEPDAEAYSEWLQKAAKAGDKPALDMLLQPVEISAKPIDAEAEIEESEASNEARFEEALRLSDEEAIFILRELAEKGYAPAQNELGERYITGRGVVENYEIGVDWLKKAADQGLAEALDNLGDCYYYGIGVEENEKKAAELYRQAAEVGVASAQYSLGNCYYTGTGIKEDKALAFQWLLKAAEQGNPDAQNMLGMCFLRAFL